VKKGIIYTAEPYNWLKEQKPLMSLIRDKKYGLQRMIYAGVTLDDLLRYGYEWKDIRQFKDFHETPERGRLALQALGCTAEHFRDHQFGPQLLKDFQINGRHLVELFGIQFSGNKLIVVNGQNKKPWSMSDLVSLGFKMEDLFGAGLSTLDQYIALNPNDEHENFMGVTQEDLSALPYSKDNIKPQEPPVVVKVVIEHQQQPPPQPIKVVLAPVPQIPSKPRVHGLKNKK
jgi:hypothetical protein